MKKISIIFPDTKFDDLKEKIDKLKEFFKNKYNYLFIFMYSEDKPKEYVGDENISFIECDKDTSYNQQIINGFDVIDGDCVILCDLNDKNYEEYLFNLIVRWEKGDKIVRLKYKIENPTFWQKISSFFITLKNKIYNFFLQIFGISKDSLCFNNFQLFDKEVYEIIASMPEKNVYLRNFSNLTNFESSFITTKEKVVIKKDQMKWNQKLTFACISIGCFIVFLTISLILYPIAKEHSMQFSYTAIMILICSGLFVCGLYFLISSFFDYKLGKQKLEIEDKSKKE